MNWAMKHLAGLVFLLCFPLLTWGMNESAVFDSANTAYAEKNYDKAVELYEKVVSGGYVAPELYYNLGNAYFKMKDYPKAILNYERARKIKPDDEDINYNLNLANQLITDKVETPAPGFLSRWKSRFLNAYSEGAWAAFSIAAFILCLILLSVYALSRHVILKQVSFLTAVLFLAISISLLFITRSKSRIAQTHDAAIVMASNVTAKGAPDEKGTALFILHEGTKVDLLRSNGSWTEIRLPNGNTGWLPSQSVEII